MKEIRNPFAGMPGYKCLGCAPDHPFGLKLKFYLDEANRQVVSEWNPNHNFEGYNEVIHGGIQSTLLDEISSWAVYVLLESAGFTARMQIRYHRPLQVNDGPVRLTAHIENFEKGLATIEAKLINKNGDLCSQGTLIFFVYPKEVAKEKFYYPGIDAFF